LALQPFGIENGERHRRTHIAEAGARFGQVRDAERLNPDERHEVHTRVEARFLLIDTPGGGFRSSASRDDVGPASNEFQRQVRGQA